jgi:hemerythrin superfamily protein
VTDDPNAIDLLVEQHGQVRTLLDDLLTADGPDKQAKFDELRRLLAVHETAEELVLRPVTRADVPDGDRIADARMAEENQAKQALAELENLDVHSPEFRDLFTTFRKNVLDHAEHEEQQEFPAVREREDAERLRAMGGQLRLAEQAAPTHPHPSARSTTANLVLGPFASVADRVRDALRSTH